MTKPSRRIQDEAFYDLWQYPKTRMGKRDADDQAKRTRLRHAGSTKDSGMSSEPVRIRVITLPNRYVVSSNEPWA